MEHADTLRVGCVVMAAGNSSRFGSNKLLHRLDGRTFIERALDAVPPALLENTVVVTQYDAVAALAERRGLRVLRNEHPDWGVSHTIRLGTQALQSCDGILYLVADQPHLTQASVSRIVQTWRAHPDRITGAAHGERRGNPNLFPAEFFDELCALEGDRGGTRVIRAHPDRLLTVQVPEPELADHDAPAKLGGAEEKQKK